jgi:hypothetical protein
MASFISTVGKAVSNYWYGSGAANTSAAQEPTHNNDSFLHGDKDYIMQEISRNPKSFEKASEELKQDRDFIFSIVGQYPRVLRYVDDTFKGIKKLSLLLLTRM